MTRMENLDGKVEEHARQDAVYERAMRRIAAQERKREAQGYAVMSAAMGYGAAAHGDGWFGRVTHAAKLFCIGVFFAAWPFFAWWALF